MSDWDNTDDLIFVRDGAPPHFALIVRVVRSAFSRRVNGMMRVSQMAFKKPRSNSVRFLSVELHKRGV